MIPFDIDFIRATGRRGLFFVSMFSYIRYASWIPGTNSRIVDMLSCFVFFLRRSKGTKNDISGTGSLLYEHNAMILSGVISDLVEPWTIHESKFKQRNKLNPTFNPTL